MVVLGIDLGTTYSCGAVYRNGNLEVIPNNLGLTTTPSVVCFDHQGNITVGEAVRNRLDINSANVIFDVKRLIGRRFDDPIVQEDIKYWPFNVIGEDNVPKIRVNSTTYDPETISAHILKSIKADAEQFLGVKITEAVITVPAYFNDGQRQATRDAGEIAGLKVLRIINEPTAAAIAYHEKRPPKELTRVLVFDLGGGTFDISLLEMKGNEIEVKAVGGDSHLGGEDFDNAIVDYCLGLFQDQTGIDIKKGKESKNAEEKEKSLRALRRIKMECEKQKQHLTAARSVKITLDAAYGDHTINSVLTRDKFNELIKGSVQKCLDHLTQVISDAGLTKDRIDEVVLVGGSTKIVFVRDKVSEYFNGKKLSMIVKPGEAVAHGAAILAYTDYTEKVSTGKGPNSGGKKLIKDVYPLPIGIKIYVKDGDPNDFDVIVKKNTPVPCSQLKNYVPREDNMSSVSIKVFEGESPSCAGNHPLGEFLLNLPPKCSKTEPIDVRMEINEEGILHVTAVLRKDKSSNGRISVTETKGRLAPEQIRHLRLLVAKS